MGVDLIMTFCFLGMGVSKIPHACAAQVHYIVDCRPEKNGCQRSHHLQNYCTPSKEQQTFENFVATFTFSIQI